MLADEYVLSFLSLSVHIRLIEYIPATLHNFNISFSTGFSYLLTEHRIPAQQQAVNVDASKIKSREFEFNRANSKPL